MEVGDENGGDELGTPDGEIGPDTGFSFWYLVPFLRMMMTELWAVGEGWGDVGAWPAELAQVPDHFWVVGPARACWELKGGLLVGVNNEGHLVGVEQTA